MAIYIKILPICPPMAHRLTRYYPPPSAPGSQSSKAGYRCEPCDIGRFASVAGAIACADCGNLWHTSSKGSTSCDTVISGYYLVDLSGIGQREATYKKYKKKYEDRYGVECQTYSEVRDGKVPCTLPEGVEVVQGMGQNANNTAEVQPPTVETFLLVEGYYRYGYTAEVLECKPADACAGGNAPHEESCNLGYKSAFCGRCGESHGQLTCRLQVHYSLRVTYMKF